MVSHNGFCVELVHNFHLVLSRRFEPANKSLTRTRDLNRHKQVRGFSMKPTLVIAKGNESPEKRITDKPHKQEGDQGGLSKGYEPLNNLNRAQSLQLIKQETENNLG